MKTGAKVIVRNTVHNVGDHTQKSSVCLRQKQSSNTHPKAGACLPLNEEDDREVIETTSPGLCFLVFVVLLANHRVLFLTPDRTQGHPQHACASFGQEGFQSKAWWEAYPDLLQPGTLSLSDPEGSFCACGVGVSLTPRMGRM